MALAIGGAFDGQGEGTEQPAEFRLLLFGDTLDGEFTGEAFQGAADVEGFFDFARRQRGDVSTAAGMNLDESFGGKLLDGVADGSDADAEFVGDLFDLKALAWFEDVGENGLPERVVDFICGAAARDLGEFHGQEKQCITTDWQKSEIFYSRLYNHGLH